MSPFRASDSNDIIQALRSGAPDAVDMLYERYRADFFRWAGRRFEANRQDLEDAWQEAVIAFYEQVTTGRLTDLRFQVRSWLFAVGYKRLLNNHRKIRRILWKDSIDEALRHDAFGPAGREAGGEKRESIQTAMKAMSVQCREMLIQRYYQEKSIEEIRMDWEHNNVNTTSATLSRCLKRLKELIKTARMAGV